MFAGIALLLVVFLYRLTPIFMDLGAIQPEWMPNFSPMAALCLCAAACLPKRWAIALPFVCLIGSDIILNWHYTDKMSQVAGGREFSFVSTELLGKTLAFAMIAYFGWQLRGQAKLKTMIPAAAGSSLFFYLVSNTASWITEPAYPVTLSGWTQAVYTGLPGYIPSWMFLRNSLVSDLVFTVLFLACLGFRYSVPQREKQPTAAW